MYVKVFLFWLKFSLNNMSSLLALPDWISHIPKVDDSHGIATVAPAHTMQLEGTYEDFEILGDTAVRQS